MDYLHYLDVVKLRSPRTINGYYLDLRGFFRYMMMVWNLAQPDTPPEEIDLTHITKRQISTITKRDIINYLDYARSNDNGAKARARKLSALRGFFGYLCHQINELSENPTDNINLGSPKKSLPKYLSASESIRLLKNIQSDFYERDYCIIVFFLNCGMRLAELITINLGDFKDDTIKITGKGNKERLVYLNTACQAALEHYLPARAALNNLRDKEALFVSKKTGRRLTARRVEQIVANCLFQLLLVDMGINLRRGYILVPQDFLDGQHIHTALIHECSGGMAQLKQAVEASPLADTGYIAPQSKAMTDLKQDTGEEDS